MKKANKTLAVLLALLMLLSLCACGEKDPVGVSVETHLGIYLVSVDAGKGSTDETEVHIADELKNGGSLVLMPERVPESRDGVIDLLVFDTDMNAYAFDNLDLKDGDKVSLEWDNGIARAAVHHEGSTTNYEAFYLLDESEFTEGSPDGNELSSYLGFWAYDDCVTIGILESDIWAHYTAEGLITGTAAYQYDGSCTGLFGVDGSQIQYLLKNGDGKPCYIAKATFAI